MWDGFQPPHKSKLCSFISLEIFAGNSSFKAVLAASPELFTAHYRSVVPAHNTPNNISRELQQFQCGDYELLHISAVVGNSLQPFSLFTVLNASPRNRNSSPGLR